MWQLTIVAVIAVAALGLSTGRAKPAALEAAPEGASRRGPRMALGIAVIGLAWGIICAQAVPWLADAKVSDSQAAVRRGDLAAATTAAADARSLEPWASSPYLQLALVAEQRGDLADATRWIASAIQRSPSDWSIWYVASRIQAKDGLRAAASRSYAKAAALNPRSPLFAASR
jgi:predicted Zn-dependent protease